MSNTSNITSTTTILVARPRPRCHHCGKHFSRSFTLNRHLQKHQAQTHTYQCPECNDNFSREDVLNRHLLERHTASGDKVECGACGRTMLRRYWAQHYENPMCRKLQRTTTAASSTNAAHPSPHSSSDDDRPATLSYRRSHSHQAQLPRDRFWSYSDILFLNEQDKGLAVRGPLSASSYVMFLHLQGDRTSRLDHGIGLSYVTLRNAMPCLRSANEVGELRRDVLFARSMLGLVDHQLGRAEGERAHLDAFKSMGGTCLTMTSLEYLIDADKIMFALVGAAPEKSLTDEGLFAAYQDFLAVGHRLGVFATELKVALEEFAQGMIVARRTMLQQELQ